MDSFRRMVHRVTGTRRGNNRGRRDSPSPSPGSPGSPSPRASPQPAYRDWDVPVHDSPAPSPPSRGTSTRGRGRGRGGRWGRGTGDRADDDLYEVAREDVVPKPFRRAFKTFSDCFYHNQTVARGMAQSDKGIFPESVLGQLRTRTGRAALASSAGFDAPMMFRVLNPRGCAVAYCGVMQFEPAQAAGVAADVLELGEAVYLPNWLMANLAAEEGTELLYEQVFLPRGTSVVLQPLDKMFYERAKVNDPRSLLESMLSKNCLFWRGECVNCYDTTTGSVIPFRVTKLEPAVAVCIVDADLKTEFEAMPGLEEYERQEREKAQAAAAATGAGGSTTTTTTRTPSPVFGGSTISPNGAGAAAAAAGAQGEEEQILPKENEDEDVNMDDEDEDNEEDEAKEEEEKNNKQPYVPFGGQGHSLRSSSDSVNTGAQAGSMFPSTVVPGAAAATTTTTPQESSSTAGTKQQQSGGMTSAGEPEDTTDCTQCPNCGKYIANVSYQLHAMRCARFNTRCAVCGESVARAALAAHNRERHEPVRCADCGALVLPPALAQHREHECPEGLVGCPYCELRVLRKQLRAHEQECGAKSTHCPVCGATVAKNKLAEHMSLGCPPAHRSPSPVVPSHGAPSPVPSWPGPREPTVIVDDGDDENNDTGGDSSLVQCPKCGRAFGVGAIVAHVEQCGNAASSPVVVEDDAPRGGEAFVCPFCGRADFAGEHAYLDHMTECQTRGPGGAPAQLPCPQCGRTFAHEGALNAHFLEAHCDQEPAPQGRGNGGEQRCRFCGMFSSSNPVAVQMHETLCSGRFNVPM